MADFEICDEDAFLIEEQGNALSHFLTIVSGRLKQKVLISSIQYIESNLHRAIIHTTIRDYECYQKLDAYESELNKYGFLRCHKSFLVSMHYVTHFLPTCLKLADIELPISRRYQSFFREYVISGNIDVPEEQMSEYGSMLCTQGTYLGSVIYIYPEQKILIGRDSDVADIQINLPLVSRIHCELVYHYGRREYEITDYSLNGVFINGKQRLIPKTPYIIPNKTELCFGDKETVYKLL